MGRDREPKDREVASLCEGASGQLLDTSHPVNHGLAVNVEPFGTALPRAPRREECSERIHEIRSMDAVVLDEGSENSTDERLRLLLTSKSGEG